MTGALRREPLARGTGWHAEHWRFAGSNGGGVHADLTLPARSPWGIVLAAHGMGGRRDVPYVQGAARAWARDGLAMLSVDAPGHGDRAAMAQAAASAPDWVGRFREAVGDLARGIDAIEEAGLGELPLGFLGFSMGAITGTALLASDHRVRAAVLVIAGSLSEGGDTATPIVGSGTLEAIDPVRHAPGCRAAVLMMNADGDTVFDRTAALALYDAFPGRKQLVFFPGTHAEWSEPALRYRTMLGFFREELTS